MLLNNSDIASLLDYTKISKKTVPLRLGIEGTSGKLSRNIDIAFLIDSTGSMTNDITAVYNIIENFTKLLENSSIDYRLALIEYKDYPTSSCGSTGDFAYNVHKFNGKTFTDNATIFRSRIESLVASGGEDLPEAMLTALNSSLNIEWRENARKFNIILTDAQPHAVDCATGVGYWSPAFCGPCKGATPPLSCKFSDLSICKFIIPNTDLSCNLGPKSVMNMSLKLNDSNITVFMINQKTGLCFNNITNINMTNITGGSFFLYSSASAITDIIMQIAGKMINITFQNQSSYISGTSIDSRVYPDSYIELSYNQEKVPSGLIITATKQFNDPSIVRFTLPSNSSILETVVTSYSGQLWTKEVLINNINVYNLSEYSKNYGLLGDPYEINIPNEKINLTHENIINLTTGVIENDYLNGSLSNSVIYTFLKNISTFSACNSLNDKICYSSNGCEWTVEHYDHTLFKLKIPKDYTGTDSCSYTSTSINYNNNDAIQSSIYNLLTQLDLDNDKRIDIDLNEKEIQITSSEINNIPFVWSTEIQIREWN